MSLIKSKAPVLWFLPCGSCARSNYPLKLNKVCVTHRPSVLCVYSEISPSCATAGFESVLWISTKLLVPSSSSRAVQQRLPVWSRAQRTSAVQSTGTHKYPAPPIHFLIRGHRQAVELSREFVCLFICASWFPFQVKRWCSG